ncbi:hypothetical protein JOM56_011908 [Amanita muscaria]
MSISFLSFLWALSIPESTLTAVPKGTSKGGLYFMIKKSTSYCSGRTKHELLTSTTLKLKHFTGYLYCLSSDTSFSAVMTAEIKNHRYTI